MLDEIMGAPCWLVPSQEEEQRPLSPPTMWGQSQEACSYKPGRGFSLGTESVCTPILDLEAGGMQEINVCCVSPPARGILLGRPEPTQTKSRQCARQGGVYHIDIILNMPLKPNHGWAGPRQEGSLTVQMLTPPH